MAQGFGWAGRAERRRVRVATSKSRLVCAIVTMVVLAACGGGSSSSTHATANDPNATFNYAIGQIDSPDPARTKVTNAGIFLSPVFETLVLAKMDGSFTPGLATDWSWVNSNAALRFRLRKGVAFQDGTPFNAQAVKASIDRSRAAGSSVAAQLAVVNQVDVVDDYTVDFVVNQR